jgi:hypothetical protein
MHRLAESGFSIAHSMHSTAQFYAPARNCMLRRRIAEAVNPSAVVQRRIAGSEAPHQDGRWYRCHKRDLPGYSTAVARQMHRDGS